mmetsp:Transcript_23061/g.36727  ORF Transcript_23061/g.36727 Transcript_23061/m.36727 type:complete len:255 (-) Transcript_23061:1513-2277(-)
MNGARFNGTPMVRQNALARNIAISPVDKKAVPNWPIMADPSISPSQTPGQSTPAAFSKNPKDVARDLISKTTESERESIFKVALAANDKALTDMIRDTIKSNDSHITQSKDDRKQLKRLLLTIRTLNFVVVAELSKLCGVMREDVDELLTIKLVCNVVQDEILRYSSGELVFRLLREMIQRVDIEIKEQRVDLLIGSVYKSVQYTFTHLKALILEKRVELNNPTNKDNGSQNFTICRPPELGTSSSATMMDMEL